MPIMDGFEASRNIKRLMEEGVIDRCPIVAVSANDTEEDKRRCLEAGMDEHCSKPLMEDVLRKVLLKYGY
jgi:CheY-like chemotaxis protein